MRHSVVHKHHWTFPCVCGGQAVARFVIPTNKGKFAILGTCDTCALRGDDPTTTALLASTPDDGFEDLLVSCPIMFQEK